MEVGGIVSRRSRRPGQTAESYRSQLLNTGIEKWEGSWGPGARCCDMNTEGVEDKLNLLTGRAVAPLRAAGKNPMRLPRHLVARHTSSSTGTEPPFLEITLDSEFVFTRPCFGLFENVAHFPDIQLLDQNSLLSSTSMPLV